MELAIMEEDKYRTRVIYLVATPNSQASNTAVSRVRTASKATHVMTHRVSTLCTILGLNNMAS